MDSGLKSEEIIKVIIPILFQSAQNPISVHSEQNLPFSKDIIKEAIKDMVVKLISAGKLSDTAEELFKTCYMQIATFVNQADIKAANNFTSIDPDDKDFLTNVKDAIEPNIEVLSKVSIESGLLLGEIKDFILKIKTERNVKAPDALLE